MPCFSKSDTLVASVQDTVESLKDNCAKDEIHSCSWVVANVLYNQINLIGNTTHVDVKALWQDLSVSSERELSLVQKEGKEIDEYHPTLIQVAFNTYTRNEENQTLQFIELIRSDS